MSRAIVFPVLLSCLAAEVAATQAVGLKPEASKPRIVVTTDLGADPDDEQSLVRLLVSANEFDIEGLVVSTGCWKKSQSNTRMLDKIVAAYGKVLPNLQVHAKGFPSLEYLKSISVVGQTGYGMDDVGDGKDTKGSDLIIASVDKDDTRPVWVGCWGGANNVAQAIWKVQKTRSEAELKKFLAKLRVFDILGQDDAGAWIAKNFPDVLYIRATGVYGWAPSDEYLDEHIQSHGPLGAVYPDRKWATEGDTPAFMHVYPNGLNDPDKIDQGGWGGRFGLTKKTGIKSMSGVKGEERKFDPYDMYGNTSEGAGAIKRWKTGYNNNFQARMDWSITDEYSKANHHPIAVVNGDKTRDVLEVRASAGSTVKLSAAGSSDPDDDSLSYSWKFYKEPSSYDGNVSIKGDSSAEAEVSIPANAADQDIHVILELHDDGLPNLYAYRRVVVSVGALQANKADKAGVPRAVEGEESVGQSFNTWLKSYIPTKYADAKIDDHGGWTQAHLSNLIASWAPWNESGMTLKGVHDIEEGEALFVSKAKNSDWPESNSVTYWEGAGYYISSYQAESMADWNVEGSTVVQFDGDPKQFASEVAKAFSASRQSSVYRADATLLVSTATAAPERLRVIMTSDFPPIGVVKSGNVPNNQKSDPDDMQSMVRFLLYSNEFDVEGLIASAGTFAMEAHKKNILDVIDRYEMVYDNLKKHDANYPTPDALRAVTFEGKGNNHGLKIKWGRGKQPYTDIVGEGLDSEASRAIIAAADKPDPRPIWIGVWGGPREVAQAIWDVKNTRSEAELKAFISKLRVFLIAYQDASHGWLMEEFPDLFIIDSRKTYQGMFGGRDALSDLAWVNKHVRNDHGPLAEIYPHEGMGCTGVCEGDSPTFMYLVSANRGINDPEDPTQPSWGGQYRRKPNTSHYVDGPGGSSIAKWREQYQREFAVRVDWCLGP
ncbi:hypothetical protein KOR34_01300 [Posidoniimonas corsicana]|uniref:Inosine-uridine preferring nucleoside hydrolase n=1 Tax=Posidoniimonas corsicana TaxID=1938618 RepID=A0A5C5VC12_9BACT|nr:DUF1593 domain-containing protein [Posidoniimonas corsicana]TWT35242.1 hypothetical protein KOR34_01300 [Posidoniimonas corsicana]